MAQRGIYRDEGCKIMGDLQVELGGNCMVSYYNLCAATRY
jgi:hypothetical protein